MQTQGEQTPKISKFFIAVAVLAVILTQTLFAVGQKKMPARPPQYVNSDGNGFCPLQTAEEWQQFLIRYASNPKWVETCEDSQCDAKYFAYVKENVQGTFIACAKFIAENENINRCTGNLRNFTTAWLQQHNEDTYGFTVDNHTYLSRQEAGDKPAGMMKLPVALEQALPDLSRVVKAAQANGWKYLVHDSALGGFRTFVLISDPLGRFDQWTLINLRKGEAEIESGTPLSLITVQKRDSPGRKLDHVRIHFRDYSIDKAPRGYRLSLFEKANGKCYSCHVSGMRQLIARRTPILEALPVKGEEGFNDPVYARQNDFAYRRVLEFNRRIRSYGMPDWDGLVVPENHGPVLGATQNCTECHDGQSRGIITVSTSPAQLRQKVQAELNMPPDTHLPQWLERHEMKNPALNSSEELSLSQAMSTHQGLMEQFLAMRSPTLSRWLLEESCVAK